MMLEKKCETFTLYVPGLLFDLMYESLWNKKEKQNISTHYFALYSQYLAKDTYKRKLIHFHTTIGVFLCNNTVKSTLMETCMTEKIRPL